MALLVIWFALMPYILIAIAVGLIVLWAKSSNQRLKWGLTVPFVAFAVFWFSTTGRTLLKERADEQHARNYKFLLPAKFEGTFGLRVEYVDSSFEPETKIPVSVSGLALLRLPRTFDGSISESRFNAEDADGVSVNFNGLMSRSFGKESAYIFCVKRYADQSGGGLLECDATDASVEALRAAHFSN